MSKEKLMTYSNCMEEHQVNGAVLLFACIEKGVCELLSEIVIVGYVYYL